MELYGSFALRPGDEVAFAGAMLMCMGIGMVLSVACYVLEALSLYTIAQRRGIRKPWLAWIPVVNVWIVGSISDQYQYVVNRRIQNRRKGAAGSCHCLRCDVFRLYGLPVGSGRPCSDE